MSSYVEVRADGVVLVRVKAVPGASRDEIVGVLGDRVKVRVSAAPEGGKANRAIAKLLAGVMGVRAPEVTLVAGAASAQKTFAVAAGDAAGVVRRLAEAAG